MVRHDREVQSGGKIISATEHHGLTYPVRIHAFRRISAASVLSNHGSLILGMAAALPQPGTPIWIREVARGYVRSGMNEISSVRTAGPGLGEPVPAQDRTDAAIIHAP